MKRGLKFLAYALVVLLAVQGIRSLFPKKTEPVQVYYPTDFSTNPKGIVGFESFTPRTAREVMEAGTNSENVIGGGLLVLPHDAAPTNKVPAVVILHGSGGDWTGRSVHLANRLADHGIAGNAAKASGDLAGAEAFLPKFLQ